MTSSLFKRIFSYRQRENHSPLENFITEIFSYCLEIDVKFRSDFFAICLDIHDLSEDFEIETQLQYEGYGRPDIEINFKSTSILFECKVEAIERLNQLEDYSSILKKYKTSSEIKHIVYLTKYFEHKRIKDESINLHLVRWFSVFQIIDDSHSEITNQFKTFLKEQGMEKIKNFTIQDLLAMKTISQALTKMDEVLEQFKSEFVTQFGGYSKDSTRTTRLPGNLYINYVNLEFERLEYYLLIGFFWWFPDMEVPVIGISVEIPIRRFENSDLPQILDRELVDTLDWEFEDDGERYYYHTYKPLTDFMISEEDHIPLMKKFLQGELNSLYALRNTYPQLFRKSEK